MNQTKLPNGTSILSPEMWKEATRDQLASMNIPSNILFAESHNPHLICEIHKWSQAVDLKSDNNVGWNLLQTVSVIEPVSVSLSLLLFPDRVRLTFFLFLRLPLD